MKIEISHLEVIFETQSPGGIGPTAKLYGGPGIQFVMNDHGNGVITGIGIFSDRNSATAAWESLVRQNIEMATMGEEEEE